jgi:hypothetical protein
LPQLVRDERQLEDIRKVDGDDAADAARYGLVSGARYAGVGAHNGAPGAGNTPPPNGFGSERKFFPGMPVGEQIARQVTAEDPTSKAIHFVRLGEEAKRQLGAHKLPRRRK